MDQKDKTATIVAAVIVGVLAVTGTVYAAVSTSRDEAEPESSSSIITTTTEPATEATSEAATTTTTTQPPKTTTAAPTQPATPGATASAPQEITFEYDAELSRQIAEMVLGKYPDLKYSPKEDLFCHPENVVHDNEITLNNDHRRYIGELNGSDPVQTLAKCWKALDLLSMSQGYTGALTYKFNIEAYRYSNGYYYIYLSK